eukprot:gene14116-5109_t
MLLCNLPNSHQTILRLPCGHVFADFKIYEVGKALSGSVIQITTGTNELDCIQSCTGHKNCLSYNINPGEKKCELNSKTSYHEGAALVSRPGWIYKSTNYNETLIGSTCQELQPCPTDMLCKDTCNYQFYECIQCNRTMPEMLCALQNVSTRCESNACQNNGNCSESGSQHTGTSCDKDIITCEKTSCLNGGTCENFGGIFSCQCKPGYIGARCEHDIDDCVSNPCKNGGTCVDGANQWTCNCPPGFGESVCYPKCGLSLNGSSGSIASRNYPSKYPHDHTCLWTIKLGIVSKVRIEFLDFVLEDDSSYQYDSVKIFDGPSTASPLIAKLSGLTLSVKTYISSGNSITIRFKTDNDRAKKGFELTWSEIV